MVSLLLMDLVLDNLTLSKTRVEFQQGNILPTRSEMLKKKKKNSPLCVFETESFSKRVDSFLRS